MTPENNQPDRYARNIALPEIGVSGQAAICSASVLIVGCGALGSMSALYLAGMGVGRIGLADFDTVSIHNLQRQVAFVTADAGRRKAQCLAERIRALNPDVEVVTYFKEITSDNAPALLAEYDVVLEATDSARSKHTLPAVALRADTPCVLGGIRGWTGMVTTFLPTDLAAGAVDDYTALFGACPEGAGPLPGVFGPVTGIIATSMAAEAAKLITGAGTALSGRLLTVDALTATTQVLRLD